MLHRNMKGLVNRASGLSALAAALMCTAAAAGPRSSPASCQEAAGKDSGALYRDTYAVVVKTCGPAATATRPMTPPMALPSPPDRAKCHGLAAALVDFIEDDRMGTAGFAAARDAFAAACAPK